MAPGAEDVQPICIVPIPSDSRHQFSVGFPPGFESLSLDVDRFENPFPVETGEVYEVPHAFMDVVAGWVPIVTPSHLDGDGDCLEPGPRHWAIDFRFVRDGGPTSQTDVNGVNAVWSHETTPTAVLSAVCKDADAGPAVSHPFVVERLARKYAAARPVLGGRCPHRGSRLVDACGRCPSHGSVWDPNGGGPRHPLPYSLQFPTGGPRAEIRNSRCSFVFREPVTWQSHMRLELVDAGGEIVPSHGMSLERSAGRTFQKDDVLNVKMRNCGCNPAGSARLSARPRTASERLPR